MSASLSLIVCICLTLELKGNLLRCILPWAGYLAEVFHIESEFTGDDIIALWSEMHD